MPSGGDGITVRTIDLHFLGQPGIVAAFQLGTGDDIALIEVGPGSTSQALLQALNDSGIGLEQVRHLLVTHVHLDHAGAAGLLLERMPNARLYVHEIGAPHLIDPSKLIASATRIYGKLMDRLWGAIIPVPADRVVTLRDNQVLELAGRRLQVLYTPGHAVHHVTFRDLASGEMFVGDVAGARMQGCDYVRPPTPPPDLDLDAWDASLDRINSLNPTALYVTHFGRFGDTRRQVEELRRRLRSWEEIVFAAMRVGQDQAAIAVGLQRLGDEELARVVGPDVIRQYEMASSYVMNVSGYERYLRKRHPELALPATSL
jgi:glyoxylase-like metal-dependent hydrolase (beta-lactamase superfamily II)